MAARNILEQPSLRQFTAHVRRFIYWLTSPHVLLALLMLVLMIYLIVIPIFRMVSTTITFQEKDLVTQPDAVEGQFTFFHWTRMLASKISTIMLYTPLRHSLEVSAGGDIDCHVTWVLDGLVCNTHRYARQKNYQRSGDHPLYDAILDDRNGLDGHVQKSNDWWVTRNPGVSAG